MMYTYLALYYPLRRPALVPFTQAHTHTYGSYDQKQNELPKDTWAGRAGTECGIFWWEVNHSTCAPQLPKILKLTLEADMTSDW